MTKTPVHNIKDAEEARSIAIEWQDWASKQSMSYGEAAEWEAYFRTLAENFHLEEEFAENGII